MEKIDFEITIPVLNEELTLERNIKILYKYLIENFPNNSWKIIIADNGSNDRTEKIGENLEHFSELIKFIKTENRGVGAALKKSWNQSNAAIIGFMDLDLAVDLNYLKIAINQLEQSTTDMIYGSRLNLSSKVIGRSLKREIISRIFNQILRLYFKSKISDGMCGFKFLKKDLYHELYNNGAKSDGWFFSSEIILVCEKLGYILTELPVTWTDDRSSRVKVIQLSIEYLRDMKKLKKYLNG